MPRVARADPAKYIYIYIYIYILHTFTFQLLDKSWSQVSSLLLPGSCLQFLSRIGWFSNPTARRLFIEYCQHTLSRFPQVNLSTSYIHTTSVFFHFFFQMDVYDLYSVPKASFASFAIFTLNVIISAVSNDGWGEVPIRLSVTYITYLLLIDRAQPTIIIYK